MPDRNELLASAQSSCDYIAAWSDSIKNPQDLEQNPERSSAIAAQTIFLGSTAKIMADEHSLQTPTSRELIRLRDKLSHIPWNHIKFDLLFAAIKNDLPAYSAELKNLAQRQA